MKTLRSIFTLCLILVASTLLAQDLEIYVSSGNGAVSGVKKFTSTGVFESDFVQPGDGGINWPQDIIFLEDQNIVLVSGLNNTEILKYNSENGNFDGIFATVAGGPTRMEIGADGLLYVLQWATNSKVLRYQVDGTFVDEFTNTGVTNSIGLAWDTEGSLYVSSYGLSLVRKYNNLGEDQGNFITGLQGPTNIWFDPSGNGDMIVLNWNGNNAWRFDSAGNLIGDFISNIIQPEGVAFLPNGNLLIGSGGGIDDILEFESDGTPVGIFAADNGLANPNAIYIRDLAIASVSDSELSPIFVTPTIGNEFTWNTSIINNFSFLEIYNALGLLIETLIPSENEQWNADRYAEGLYFIVANEHGRKFTQKIIIKK